MDTSNIKSPDGGFYFAGDQFLLVPDGKGHDVVTAGGNITVDGAQYVILKSSTPRSKKFFKITVDDQGAIKAEEVID